MLENGKMIHLIIYSTRNRIGQHQQIYLRLTWRVWVYRWRLYSLFIGAIPICEFRFCRGECVCECVFSISQNYAKLCINLWHRIKIEEHKQINHALFCYYNWNSKRLYVHMRSILLIFYCMRLCCCCRSICFIILS